MAGDIYLISNIIIANKELAENIVAENVLLSQLWVTSLENSEKLLGRIYANTLEIGRITANNKLIHNPILDTITLSVENIPKMLEINRITAKNIHLYSPILDNITLTLDKIILDNTIIIHPTLDNTLPTVDMYNLLIDTIRYVWFTNRH